MTLFTLNSLVFSLFNLEPQETSLILLISPNILVRYSCILSSFSKCLFKHLFIYFNWRIITIPWWYLPYINMNWLWYIHVLPHSELPSLLPPHPIPLGCSRARALGALLHASNSHWSSILYMVMYMLQCYSL